MILHNVHTINGGIKNIVIQDRKIRNISANGHEPEDDFHLYFDNAIAFPGLINSHDHLDFDLFPKLGNRIYKNYLEWGEDIHQQNAITINAVLKIPKELRVQWGVYKNLLNGVTTVFNHGHRLKIENSLIDIYQDKNALHSVGLEKNWKRKLANPFNNKVPFVIHIGEGTDEQSHAEIDELIKWNKSRKKLIGIHGVAMDAKQAESFEALVWCPYSNFFLLGKTAALNELKKTTAIIFGSDSTVSADWNIWEQLRTARKTGLLTDEELLGSITTMPAKVRGLLNIGALDQNANADIVIAEKKFENEAKSFFAVNPGSILMIIKDGTIILFDERLLTQVESQNIKKSLFNKIKVNESFKYVKGNINQLIQQIRHYNKDIFIPVEPA